MKKLMKSVVIIILIIFPKITISQNAEKLKIVSKINKSLNKFYLASKTNITLEDEIISFYSLSFDETDKFNLNTVEIYLYDNKYGKHIGFSCIDKTDCIYSTKNHYHNILGIPISCTEKDANQLLADLLFLQNSIGNQIDKKK